MYEFLNVHYLPESHNTLYPFQFDRQSLSIALRFLRAKTPEQRAAVDLDTHYSQVGCDF